MTVECETAGVGSLLRSPKLNGKTSVLPTLLWIGPRVLPMLDNDSGLL